MFKLIIFSERAAKPAKLRERDYWGNADKLSLRILATTPTLRSATLEMLYSMEVPRIIAGSAALSW